METIRTSITLPFSLWKRLKGLALEQRKSLNDVMNETLEKGLKEKEE